MKLQIKQINPNPYRDMENYPINREKVEALKASIEQTGFWDNILARPKKGKKFKLPIDGIGELVIYGEPIVELAYGHHRLTALREVLKPEDTIDIPVKDLDDSTMIKIMANENMDEWKTETIVIDETVRVAKKFLNEHPEYMPEKPKKYNSPQLGVAEKGYQDNPLAFQIAKFLNWKESVVYFCMQRLDLLDKEQPEIDKEAYKKFKQPTHADRFIKAAKKWDLKPEEQDKVVREIVDSSNYGYDQIEKKVSEAKFQNKPKERKEEYEKTIKTMQFNSYAITVFNKSVDLQKHLDDLIEHKEQFSYLLFQDVKDARIRLGMLTSLKNLAGRINKLLKLIENENNSD